MGPGKAILTLVTATLLSANLGAQVQPDTTRRRHFLGTSGFVLLNAVVDDAPQFYQVNYGYWRTSRSTVAVEGITWKYEAPLGIPYGPSFGAADERYPGHVRAYGVGVAYQRFLWRSLYSGTHAVPLWQRYFAEDGRHLQDGAQLFITQRFGYHIRLRQDRWFVEPSMAFTHWPVNTNVPAAFAARNRRWPNYFLFEPGLHVGIKY